MEEITEMEMKKTEGAGNGEEMAEAIRENSAKLDMLIELLNQSTTAPAPLALMSETDNVMALSDVTGTNQVSVENMTGVTYILSQLQDYLGNLIYPHTSSRVTFRPDGGTVEAVLALVEQILNGIDGVSSSTEINDEKKLATAKAVAALNTKITGLSSDISKAIGYIDYASAVDLSNIGTGATITEDGVVRLIASRYVTGNFEPRLYINDALVWTENMAPYGSCGIQSQYFPVKKSDTVRATFSGCDTGRVEFCRFRD